MNLAESHGMAHSLPLGMVMYSKKNKVNWLPVNDECLAGEVLHEV